MGKVFLLKTLLISGIVLSAEYYVSPEGTGDCSESNPCDFQTALNNAASDGEDSTIFVLPGHYLLNSTLTYTIPLTDGGIEEDGKLTIKAYDPKNKPILDGQNTVRVLSVSSGGEVEIDGLIIQRGYTDGWGGGLYFSGDSLILKNTEFKDNEALGWGGGLYFRGGQIKILNSRFINNKGRTWGGSAELWPCGSAEILNSEFLANSVIGAGGGVDAWCNEVLISGVYYINNAATGTGGGIYIPDGSTSQIKNSTFKNNTAGNSCGGARVGGIGIIQNSQFESNTAESGVGGGICGRNLTIQSSLFRSNTAQEGGGGVIASGNVTIQSSIFDRNTAGEGGGVYFTWGTYYIINNTFYKNSSRWGGNDIDYGWDVPTGVYLYNNIFYNEPDVHSVNITANSLEIKNNIFNCDPTSPTCLSYNLFNGDLLPTNTPIVEKNFKADPLFIDPENGDFTISINSPAVDAGDPNAPNLPSTDFEGEPRIMRFSIDIGADEHPPAQIRLRPVDHGNYFGKVKIGDKKVLPYTMWSDGLTIERIKISPYKGRIFPAGVFVNEGEYEIRPGGENPCPEEPFTLLGECTFEIVFNPQTEGYKLASVEVYTNLYAPPTFKFYVSGEGILEENVSYGGGTGGNVKEEEPTIPIPPPEESDATGESVSSTGGGGGGCSTAPVKDFGMLGYLLPLLIPLLRRFKYRN